MGKGDKPTDGSEGGLVVECVVAEHDQTEPLVDRRGDPVGMRGFVEEEAGGHREIPANGEPHRGVGGEPIAHLPCRVRQVDAAEAKDDRRARRFRCVGNGKQRLEAEALEIADRVARAGGVGDKVSERDQRHRRCPTGAGREAGSP